MTSGKRTAGAAALGAAMLIGPFASPPAQASYIVTLTEVGNNVVATGSGSINLTGLRSATDGAAAAGILPSVGLIITGPTRAEAISIYLGFTGPASFGSGGPAFPSSGGGDTVGIVPQFSELFVPAGYVSESPLSDTSTYDDATFASLGVTPGTYTWTWGSGPTDDSLSVDVVPEPESLALLGTGLLALGLVRFASRRRQNG